MSTKGFLLFLALEAIFSFKQNHFGKVAQEEHFCEIILKSDHWPKRRWCSKVFFFYF